MRARVLASSLAVACLSSLAVLPLATPAPVGACSCARIVGPRATPRWPFWQADGYPENGLFTGPFQWRDSSGRGLSLVPDEAASETFGLEIERPTEMSEGDVFFPLDDCPATGECRHALPIGPADNTPPSAARIDTLTALFVEGAPAGGGGCVGDALQLAVSGTDDVTPTDELGIVAFIGATPEEVAARTTPSVMFTYDIGAPGRMLISSIGLGGAGGTERDEEPFRAAGPFCLAVSLVDWAGNIGERSETRCLDTTDRDDPSVEVVPYSAPCSGAFCSARPGRQEPRTALLGLALLGLVVAARRSRKLARS